MSTTKNTETVIDYNSCPGGRKQGHYTDYFSIVTKGPEGEALVPGIETVRQDQGEEALKNALLEASEKTGYPVSQEVATRFDI